MLQGIKYKYVVHAEQGLINNLILDNEQHTTGVLIMVFKLFNRPQQSPIGHTTIKDCYLIV